MKIEAELVKAFTRHEDRGNPAGVVYDANGLDDETMRKTAELLGFSANGLLELPIQMVSTVSPKILVGIKSLDLLRNIKPDLPAITDYSKETDTWGIYAFAPGATEAEFYARFFDPVIGIDEDAATGVAAGPLGCYADKYMTKGSQKQFVVRQGFDMGKDSTIHVDIASGVQIGGYATRFGRKTLEV